MNNVLYDTPVDFDAFKAKLTAKFPLRAAHKTRLPGIMLHHTPQSATELDAGDYYTKAWAAGVWLAGYIQTHADDFKGKRVLDLGTGSGLVAIAAAKAGAHVTAIDDKDEAVYATRIHAEINNVTLTAQKAACKDVDFSGFDIVTTSDTMYVKEIQNTLVRVVKETPITLYISDQSGWASQDDLDDFRERITHKNVSFDFLKRVTISGGASDGINNHAVTAIKITGTR